MTGCRKVLVAGVLVGALAGSAAVLEAEPSGHGPAGVSAVADHVEVLLGGIRATGLD